MKYCPTRLHCLSCSIAKPTTFFISRLYWQRPVLQSGTQFVSLHFVSLCILLTPLTEVVSVMLPLMTSVLECWIMRQCCKITMSRTSEEKGINLFHSLLSQRKSRKSKISLLLHIHDIDVSFILMVYTLNIYSKEHKYQCTIVGKSSSLLGAKFEYFI